MKYVFAVFVSYLVLKQGVSSRESKIPLSQKQSPISIDIYRVEGNNCILVKSESKNVRFEDTSIYMFNNYENMIYWVGNKSSLNDRITVVNCITNFIEEISTKSSSERNPRIVRETQQQESNSFVKLFPQVGLNRVEKSENKLYQLKEIDQIFEINPDFKHLNNQDNFVLLTEEVVYLFLGSSSSTNLKVQTNNLCDYILKNNFSDKDPSFRKKVVKGPSDELYDFLSKLRGSAAKNWDDIPMTSLHLTSQTAAKRFEYLKLSIFTFENGNVLKEKKYGALNLSMINEKSCYILEDSLSYKSFLYIGENSHTDVIGLAFESAEVLTVNEDPTSIYQLSVVQRTSKSVSFMINFENFPKILERYSSAISFCKIIICYSLFVLP